MSTFEKIRDWARDRNLIKGSNPQAQMLKMTEEVGELAHAVARGKQAEAIDAIGDCVVVLTILGEQLGINIEDAIDAAYEVIKDRKGRMENGVFVKNV